MAIAEGMTLDIAFLTLVFRKITFFLKKESKSQKNILKIPMSGVIRATITISIMVMLASYDYV
jgi:hypothetical protein